MRLNFEIKKILWSPLYCLLVLGFLGLAYLPISQRQAHQAAYVETYKKELSELTSVLAEIKIEEGSEEAPRMLGLKSDIEVSVRPWMRESLKLSPTTANSCIKTWTILSVAIDSFFKLGIP
ncbi:TPA: hypothetical protein TZC25_001524 [Streptococcus suis]|nr:hypothetical protein [Streptococcus suis]